MVEGLGRAFTIGDDGDGDVGPAAARSAAGAGIRPPAGRIRLLERAVNDDRLVGLGSDTCAVLTRLAGILDSRMILR